MHEARGAHHYPEVVGLPECLTISDPHAVKSMTNPVRFLAVDELYTSHQPRTATELASLSGVSPSSMSYHLRTLEALGIVTRGEPSEDGRERPWMACAKSYNIVASGDASASDRLGLLDAHLQPMRQRMQTVLAQRAKQAEAEREDVYTVLGMGRMLLSQEETVALRDEIGQVWRRYEDRSRGRAPSEGLVSTVYIWSVLPEKPAEQS